MDESRIFAAFSYLCFVLSGIVVYMIRDKDQYDRFHAMQSMIFTVIIFVVAFVMGVLSLVLTSLPLIGVYMALLLSLVSLLITLSIIALWIVLMYKAYTGEKYKLPIIGHEAEKLAKTT